MARQALLVSLLAAFFLGQSAGFQGRSFLNINNPRSLSNLKMGEGESESNYDAVKVDLEDGRDYPIYIGTGYSDGQVAEMLTSHIQVVRRC